MPTPSQRTVIGGQSPPIPRSVSEAPQRRQRQIFEAAEKGRIEAENRKLQEQYESEKKRIERENKYIAEYEDARRRGVPYSREAQEFIERKLIEQGYTPEDLTRETAVGGPRRITPTPTGGFSSVTGAQLNVTPSGQVVSGSNVSVLPYQNIRTFGQPVLTQYSRFTPNISSVPQEVTVVGQGLRPFGLPEKKPSAIEQREFSTKRPIDLTQVRTSDERTTKQDLSNVILVEKKPRITPEKVGRKLDKYFGNLGAAVGERIYTDTRMRTEWRAKNPQGFYYSSQFLAKPGKRESLDKFSTKLKGELEDISKPETKLAYEETGANIAIAGQYLIPFYAPQRIGLNAYSDVVKGDYISAGTTIVTGAALKAGEYVIGNVIYKAGQAFSDVRKVPYGSGYKSLTSEKFLTKKYGEFSEKSLKAIVTTKNVVNFAGKTVLTGLLVYEAERPSRMIKEGFTKEEVRLESEKAGKSFGYLKAGYEYPGAVAEIIKPLVYSAKTVYQLVPVSVLEAKDAKQGLTNFPKDIINARSYLKKILERRETKQGREQQKYFDIKVFNEQVFGFNVSPGQKPINYYPIKGNSEFVFAEYYNPLNASFYFGIPKKRGLGNYRVGFSLPETFGEAQANVLYARGAKIMEVPSAKGDFLYREGERGVFLIPTIKGKRTKSEAEALVVGKINQIGKRFYTVEETLSAKQGILFGKIFEIPEYAVSKTQARFPNPKTIEKELVIEGETIKSIQTFSKPRTQVELNKISERRAESDNYYQKKPIATIYQPSASSGSNTAITFSSKYSVTSYRKYSGSESISYPRYSSPPSASSYQPPSGMPSLSPSTPPSEPPSYPRYSSPPSIPPYRPPPEQPTKYYPPPRPSKQRLFPPNRPPTSLSNRFNDRKVFEQGFRVDITRKEKGKFGTIRSLPGIYTRQEAINIGALNIQQDIKASFKIEQVSGIASRKGISGPVGILRPSKTEPNVFVEIPRYRLSNPLEKLQIRQAKRKSRGFL